MPVIYYNSRKSLVQLCNITDWFLMYFMLAVWKYQEEVLKIAPNDVQAVLILDKAPAHPSEEKFASDHSKIKVFYLPPNITSVYGPGGNKCHEEALHTPLLGLGLGCHRDDKTKTDVDNRGECTLANITITIFALLFPTLQQHGKILTYLSSQTFRTN